MESLKGYVHAIDPTCENFEALLSPTESFYLSLLFIKDRVAAEHSMDVYILTHQALAMPECNAFTAEQRFALRRAALLHDVGKLTVPDIALSNPLRREEGTENNEQRDAYVDYLESADRGPAKLPHGLQYDAAQEARFEKLLRTPGELGEGERESLADEIFEACKAQNVHDFRFVLPTRDLLRYSNKMAQSGKGTERTRERLKTQKEDLTQSDQILAMYGIPANESFADTNARHEKGSQILLERTIKGGVTKEFAMFLNMVNSHHDNQSAQTYRSHSRITSAYLPRPEDKQACQLLRILDILAALSPLGLNERSYAAKNTPADVFKKLRFNADKGYTDPVLTKAVLARFVEPQLKHQEPPTQPEEVLEDTSAPLIFERLRVECADMNEGTLAQLSEIKPGAISTTQSSVIHVMSEAVFEVTNSRDRAAAVRGYLEKSLAFVPMLLRKVLHNDGDDFVALLKNITEEVWPSGPKGKEITAAPMRHVRLFDYLHHELQGEQIVQALGESGLSEIDKAGFPIGTGTFAPELLELAVDSIMTGLTLFMPRGSANHLAIFRQYLMEHQDMVLYMLSSAKSDHFREFDMYMARVDTAVSAQIIEKDIATVLETAGPQPRPEAPQASVGGA
jgi:hypothetical protein